ncbi:GPI anchored cell wall protein [Moelleriella libera RCEF 2490]|uniref:GPI anchored cell wall protein n=1 Tax=Moelleriella libera RCEF 2490 TaxID=1081109 RepID=A0A168E8P8_9HYPO|nr:GPI anchored cell wall protein [Moelleriella libera RCEF 2490]
MISFLFTAGVVSAAALVSRTGCDFHMRAVGSQSGPLGQVYGGQVRFGNLPQTTFYIDGGKIWDHQGRGCWWTPPTYVLQCDVNQEPEPGFGIGCDGRVSFRGQTTFYQCASGDWNQWNIYLHPYQGINCGEISLIADGCHTGCPPPASPPPPAVQPVHPPAHVCPADLHGPFEFPHLIVPLDRSNPGKAGGTSFFGEITPTISSVFNFDIPPADNGKTCSLIFLFPLQSQLETSSFTFSGDGRIRFWKLDGPATEGTSWYNRPRRAIRYGTTTVSPGHSYTITSFPCPGGQRISFELCNGGNTNLRYFQDLNPAPIGLYIRKC